jgi:hypothetical protein
MESGIISKEFYIARYIFLKNELERLPNVTFGRHCGEEIVSVTSVDPKTGKQSRRRLTKNNRDWKEYSAIAARRMKLKESLKKLLASWKMDYEGSLDYEASHYILRPNVENPFNSQFYEQLKPDSNTKEKDRKVMLNGIYMRSYFETEVAQLLDDLDIEYKYETCFRVGTEIVSPDMSMNFPEFNRCGFLEALGGLGNLGYVNKNSRKIANYINAGLYINRDVAFISSDGDYRPDHRTMRRIIGVMTDSLAKQYLFKK